MLLKILEDTTKEYQKKELGFTIQPPPQLEETKKHDTIHGYNKHFNQYCSTAIAIAVERDARRVLPGHHHPSQSRDTITNCTTNPAFKNYHTNPFFTRNDLGHSPTDLFFSRRLHPFPWNVCQLDEMQIVYVSILMG